VPCSVPNIFPNLFAGQSLAQVFKSSRSEGSERACAWMVYLPSLRRPGAFDCRRPILVPDDLAIGTFVSANAVNIEIIVPGPHGRKDNVQSANARCGARC
jgi:hypothetical protein